MAIAIQKAKPEQHERLTEIARDAKRHWGYPEAWIQIWKDALTITPEFIAGNEVSVAIDSDEIAGFCALTQSAGKVSLEHMWVDPQYIGKGIGKELFHHAIKVAAGLNADSVEIESDPNAEGFYKRMGARKIGEISSVLEGKPRVLPLLVKDIRPQD